MRMAHATLLLLLVALASSAQAILASGSGGSGWNRVPTLCEGDLCECDPSRQTMRCTCPTKGETLKLHNTTIPTTLQHLIVSHCSHVLVAGDALSSMAFLSSVEISQVNSLQLEERAFFYEPHKLVYGQIEGKWLHEVYPERDQDVKILLNNISDVEFPRASFGGHIEEITMVDVRVSRFNSYSLASTYSVIRTLRLEGCSIDYFAFQAIRKVFIENLIITSCRIRKMESSSFKEVLVRNTFKLSNNQIEVLASTALTLIGPDRVEITQNKFDQVHGDAFHLFTRGSVLVSGNTFASIRAGALRGMRPYQPQYHPTIKPHQQHDHIGDYPQLIPEPWEEQERPHELTIRNNTLMEYEAGALGLDKGYKVTYQRVQLNVDCDCDGIALVAADLLGIHTGINGFTVLAAQNTSNLHKSLWCKYSRPYQMISLSSYEESNCQSGVLSSGWSILIIAAASILFVVLLIGLALIFWCSYKRNKNMLVIPAKKTYQQTEFNIVYEPVTELQPQKMPTPKKMEELPPPETQIVTEETECLVPLQQNYAGSKSYAKVQRVGDSKETIYENMNSPKVEDQVIYEEVMQPGERKVTFATVTEDSGSREFLESDIL